MTPMPAPGEGLRLFVALEIPAEVKARLAALQSELRAALPRLRASWTRAENMHLTLRFLGNVTGESLAALREALARAAAAGRSMEVEALGLGCFPGWQRPRVLWAGVREAGGALSALQARVVAATDAFTSQPAERGFEAHLTVARIQALRGADRAALEEHARGGAGRSFGRWNASHLDLLRSELDSGGRRHTVLASLPLGG